MPSSVTRSGLASGRRSDPASSRVQSIRPYSRPQFLHFTLNHQNGIRMENSVEA